MAYKWDYASPRNAKVDGMGCFPLEVVVIFLEIKSWTPLLVGWCTILCLKEGWHLERKSQSRNVSCRDILHQKLNLMQCRAVVMKLSYHISKGMVELCVPEMEDEFVLHFARVFFSDLQLLYILSPTPTLSLTFAFLHYLLYAMPLLIAFTFSPDHN